MGQESEEIFPETRLKTESHEKMEINRTEELTLKIERNIAVSFLIPTLVPRPGRDALLLTFLCSQRCSVYSLLTSSGSSYKAHALLSSRCREMCLIEI
jgi:hypothetical protein